MITTSLVASIFRTTLRAARGLSAYSTAFANDRVILDDGKLCERKKWR